MVHIILYMLELVGGYATKPLILCQPASYNIFFRVNISSTFQPKMAAWNETPFQRSYGTHTHTHREKLKTTVVFCLHFWCHEIYKIHFGETQPFANVYYSAHQDGYAFSNFMKFIQIYSEPRFQFLFQCFSFRINSSEIKKNLEKTIVKIH